MDFFGIPVFINFEQYSNWLLTNFAFVNPQSDIGFLGYLLVLSIQLRLIMFTIKMAYSVFATGLNFMKKMRF